MLSAAERGPLGDRTSSTESGPRTANSEDMVTKGLTRGAVFCALVLGAAAAPVLSGCGGGGGEAVVVVGSSRGAVTIRWSIDGTFDPSACDAFTVADARIDIYDAAGAPVSTSFTDCRSFGARIELTPGVYSARIQMVDGAHQPRSTSLPIDAFRVSGRTNLHVDSDFPRDSFF